MDNLVMNNPFTLERIKPTEAECRPFRINLSLWSESPNKTVQTSCFLPFISNMNPCE